MKETLSASIDLAGSQTQPETQFPVKTQLLTQEQEDPTGELKRKTTALSDEMTRKFKKIKVSIGPAVDLGD